MSKVAAPSVKGWCPGALRPMASGDGLVVRVRARCGAFQIPELAALGELAATFGNGHIDVTRRANLQIRGVTEASFPLLIAELTLRGMLDASAEAEAVRNIMVAPLAGLDPLAVDMRPVVWDLERRLAADVVLQRLPGKFGYGVDGGGRLPLDSDCADVVVRPAGPCRLAVGLDTSAGLRWLGTVPAAGAAAAVAAVGHAFVEVLGGRVRGRMRGASDAQIAQIAASVADMLEPISVDAVPAPAARAPRIGVFELAGDVHAVGLGVPFGRLEARQLERLTQALARRGVGEVRLSPWRVLYAVTSGCDAASDIVATARQMGFITDPEDPLLRVEACPGAPDCPSASLDTRGVARLLAAEMSRADFRGSVHVSGCAKGCARSAAAELTLVAEGDGFLVVADGAAASPPAGFISLEALLATPRQPFQMTRQCWRGASDHA